MTDNNKSDPNDSSTVDTLETSGDENEDILARNVGELLRRGHQPPRIDEAASARILTVLESKLESSAAQKSEKSSAKKSERGRLVSLLSSLVAPLVASPLRAGALAVAAALAIVLSAALLNRGDDRSTDVVAFEPSDYENSTAAPLRVELADGTILTLRTGASLVTTGPRALTIRRGDVLFDVAKGDGPFVVERAGAAGAAGAVGAVGAGQRVVVLGTRFVLQAKDDSLMAAVIRGSVRLEAAGDELVLGAGEGALARGNEPPKRVPIPRLSHLVSWARGARARSEGQDVQPIRRGNLVARFAGRDGDDYPLPVRDFGIDIHLENQVARVAIDQTFFNEHPSQLEGLYSFSLPSGAAISRLAMYVDGDLMEAGIAERSRARHVYESIVYRRRDPALMEWMAGNEVKVRIFPLFGRQEKRILLSYTQSIERLYDDVQLTVPLPRLEKVGRFHVSAKLVDCGQCEVVSTSHAIETTTEGDDLLVSIERKSAAIEDDLLLTIRMPTAPLRVATERVKDETLVLARLRPSLSFAATERAGKPRRWVILHDTSASRQSIERAAQVHVIDRLLDELDESDEVAVVAFDATVRQMRLSSDDAFISVSNADRKKTHDFADSEGRAGVGYTDLGAGLKAAVALLAAAPRSGDFEPMILYVGDGIVTGGERRLGELVSLVQGRATVVALGVGATHDDLVLGGLAGETGGYSAVLNPGQDLDWRVFDLVASLASDRVTELAAAVEGSETPVYLSTRQLADGDELALTARLPAAISKAASAKIRLTGRRGGKLWKQDIDVDLAAASGGAAYLSRLWARDRIAALLADDALDDAAPEAGEQRADHKAEIVELALANWLLTPYTSLLVLENDAAYKQYKVARSSMAGWAAYQVPKTIEVKAEPLTAGIDLAGADIGALIYRTPSALFVPQAQPTYFSRRAAIDELEQSSLWGTVGQGQFGSIGFGRSGTGKGFEVGGGGILGALTKAAERPWEAAEGGLLGNEPKSEPAVADLDSQMSFGGEASELVTGDSAFNGPRFERRRQAAPGRSRNGFRGPSVLRSIDVNKSAFLNRSALGQPMVPAALTHANDQRFLDLTSLLPAMFSSDLDRVRQRLVDQSARSAAAKDSKGLELDPAAAKMIDRARQLAGRRRYTGEADQVIDVDSSGRFHVERRTLTGLRESLYYDGDSLVTDYPELELSVSRQIGPAEPILLESEVPMLLAGPASLAKFYAVKRIDDGSISLEAAKESWKLIVRFDDKGRLIAVERHEGALSSVELAITYESGRVVLDRGDSKTVFGVEAVSDDAITARAPSREVAVAMPLRHPDLLKAKLEGAMERRLQHQLAASYVALGLFSELGALAVSMAAEAPMSTGELALTSGGINSITAAQAKRALVGEPSLVRRYLESSRRFREGGGDAFASIARDPSWVGTLALLRQVQARSWQDAAAATSKLVGELVERRDYSTFAFLGVHAFAQSQLWQSPKLVTAAWRQLIEHGGSWAPTARIRLASSLVSTGKYEEAAREWEAIADAAIARGEVPPLDYQTTYAFTAGPRGEAGWKHYWARLRDRVLAAGENAQTMALLDLAASLGFVADIETIASALEARRLSNSERISIIQIASRAGLTDLARRLFAPLEEAVASDRIADAEVVRLASAFASQRGDALEAAKLFERALDLEGDDDAELSQVRAEFGHLIDLYGRAAKSGRGVNRELAVAKMIEVSGDWRAVDPDNAAIDSQVSGVLFAVGDEEEAMRVLSTAIERRPMEGRSFETVATALEGQGRLGDAIGLWRRALSVEPENPSWALRLAKALAAQGKSDEAKTVLDAVLARKNWQERFVWIVEQVRATRKQL